MFWIYLVGASDNNNGRIEETEGEDTNIPRRLIMKGSSRMSSK